MPNDPKTGHFIKGQHWRAHQPFWDRAWMIREYVEKRRGAAEIAAQFAVTENAIHFWLKRHGIKGRTVTEVRAFKHWGSNGPKNPMYGKRGVLNPNWRGGLTPLRQAIYAKSEWRELSRAVRKRDKVCRLCGSAERTEIHHIDPFSQAPLLVLDIGNAILLCKRCHGKMRGKENRWKRRLYRLIEGGEQTV